MLTTKLFIYTPTKNMYSMYCIVYSKSCFYVRACIFIVIHEKLYGVRSQCPPCVCLRALARDNPGSHLPAHTSVRRLVASFHTHFRCHMFTLGVHWRSHHCSFYFILMKQKNFIFGWKSLATCFRSFLLLRWTNV